MESRRPAVELYEADNLKYIDWHAINYGKQVKITSRRNTVHECRLDVALFYRILWNFLPISVSESEQFAGGWRQPPAGIRVTYTVKITANRGTALALSFSCLPPGGRDFGALCYPAGILPTPGPVTPAGPSLFNGPWPLNSTERHVFFS